MKLIIAYIQPEKLNDVKQELYKEEIFKISVTNAMGCGQQMGYTETYRGVDVEVNLLKKVRIEIAVTDSFAEKSVDAIVKGARTGEIGDGKIFILPVEQAPGHNILRGFGPSFFYIFVYQIFKNLPECTYSYLLHFLTLFDRLYIKWHNLCIII